VTNTVRTAGCSPTLLKLPHQFGFVLTLPLQFFAEEAEMDLHVHLLVVAPHHVAGAKQQVLFPAEGFDVVVKGLEVGGFACLVLLGEGGEVCEELSSPSTVHIKY
jgi:hypothetical protein